MLTREELAALSDEAVNQMVAEQLMGWTKSALPGIGSMPAVVWWSPPGSRSKVAEGLVPPYTTDIRAAWSVVGRIMRIPQSEAEASVAPNTRFGYAFEREAFKLACSTEQEAARWVCEQALLAWNSGPLVPGESEQSND